MAVYKRIYKAYDGRFTPTETRFLVLPKYSFGELFSSRPLLIFFIACFFPTVFATAWIYLANNAAVQAMMGMEIKSVVQINGFFFANYLIAQGWLGFFMVAWIGPGLISSDLSNDALPLYLSRPFTKAEYVVGKFCVVAILLSAITWVPGTLLFGLQTSLAGWTWFSQNYWILGAVFVGAWVWIIVLALLVLAISAWVRWRIAATAIMLGIFFLAAGFGEAVNEILRTNVGKIFNIGYMIVQIWYDLFRVDTVGLISRSRDGLPIWVDWMCLTLVAVFSLLLLNKRLKAKEVVR